MLGEQSPISKSIRNKPAAAECECENDDDAESEVEADSTPEKPKANNTKTPEKFAESRQRIPVGDKTWEARWQGIVRVLPKECLPQVPH